MRILAARPCSGLMVSSLPQTLSFHTDVSSLDREWRRRGSWCPPRLCQLGLSKVNYTRSIHIIHHPIISIATAYLRRKHHFPTRRHPIPPLRLHFRLQQPQFL